jgi:hypothetical protein
MKPETRAKRPPALALVGVRVPPSTRAALECLAVRENASLSELGRRALENLVGASAQVETADRA